MSQQKPVLIKLLWSLPLLFLLSLCFQQYQIGLLEKKINKIYPKLSSFDLSSSSPLLDLYVDQLANQNDLASLRHWQRGLLYEWQGGEENLKRAVAEIELAISQRPAWPLMWRDLMRIGWKQGLSVEERTLLLKNFRRVGDWNRQSVAALAKLYLPRWRGLAEEEQAWLSQHVPKVIGARQWVEQTKLLVALQIMPAHLCAAIEAEPEILEGCDMDLTEYVNSLK